MKKKQKPERRKRQCVHKYGRERRKQDGVYLNKPQTFNGKWTQKNLLNE